MTGAPVTLAWYGCDLASGYIAEELPSLTPTQVLGRRLCTSTSTSFNLDLTGAPAAWEQATDPGRTLLVAVDTLTGLPVWSGIPLPRAGGSSTVVTISAATPECYLDRRYTGTYSATGTDITTIMGALAAVVLTNGPALVLDTIASGTMVDFSVLDSDDHTVLSALQTLAAMDGAPEFTIDTVWGDAAQTMVQLILRIHPTIGVQSAQPGAVFDMPGCLTDYTLTESYEAGKGANNVIAEGQTAGASRTLSTTYTASALISSGWPQWDYRFTPGQGITSTTQLDAHAAAALATMQTGSRSWTLDAAASAAPRLGVDWALGDSLGIQIDPGISPRHPAGITTTARAYGWDLDPAANKITPILLEG